MNPVAERENEKMVPGLDASLGLGVIMHNILALQNQRWSRQTVNAFLLYMRRGKQRTTEEAGLTAPWKHTGDDLWALKVFVRMDVARLESQIQAHQQQCQIGTRPHFLNLHEGIQYIDYS